MEIGAIINEQYSVVEHIGRGGMADVWSARDLRLRRLVAIKTIATGLSTTEDPVSLFEKEAQTIAQLEHPHILPVHDFGDHQSNLYIVMRYITGGSLEEHLNRGALDVEQVLYLAEAIARALDYAHENNVIHLDLKPPNILLDSSGSPYLADFGLAAVLDHQGRARNPGSGTLLYMAPEQLTADTIDHRADIYSFCVMLFHMLTGELPFEGTKPLAIQQVQFGEEIPPADEINEDLPFEVSEILERGTSFNPAARPDTHMEVVEALREVLQPGTTMLEEHPSISIHDTDEMRYLEDLRLQTEQLIGDADPALLEGIDIYTKARHNWQGGQGRFLLGVTHFMLMSDYYREAEAFGLMIDDDGLQMLLRGALEFDHDLDYWWEQSEDDSRRWVCLHALRSGTSPTRIRALYRLETLPDQQDKDIIPQLVAEALEVERDPAVKIATLRVLSTRIHLIRTRPSVQIKTQYQGRLLGSMTRIGIQLTTPTVWRTVLYSKAIDTLIAETAFDSNPNVAEYAARTVGRMRSLTAITHLADAQRDNRPGALEALGLVRDETPSLPDAVSPEAQFYAWLTNTTRRLTQNPLAMAQRFTLAFFGGWLGFGLYIFLAQRGEFVVTARRLSNSIGLGVLFAIFAGLSVIVAEELSRRLTGFWSWGLRLLIIGSIGWAVSTTALGSFHLLFYQSATTDGSVLRLAGILFALPFTASALLNFRGATSVALLSLTVFGGIYGAAAASDLHRGQLPFTIAIIPLLGLLYGAFLGWHIIRKNPATTPLMETLNVPQLVKNAISVGAGLVWGSVIWLFNSLIADQLNTHLNPDSPILSTPWLLTWDGALLGFFGALVFGIFIIYWQPLQNRILSLVSALLAFAVGYFALAETLLPVGTPFVPQTVEAIMYYDDPLHFLTFILPMAITTAIGAYGSILLQDWWHFIDKPIEAHRRGEWLATMLGYILVMSALVSLLSLFSLEINVVWALFWSVWGFATFVCALATWRWARWGANGLIGSAVIMFVGSVVLDVWNTIDNTTAETVAPLLQDVMLFDSIAISALVIWSIWGGVQLFFAWGVYRNRLWGGIGTLALLLMWFFVASVPIIQGSTTIFALTNIVLLAYALRPAYGEMEPSRFSLRPDKRKRRPDAVTPLAFTKEAPEEKLEDIKPTTKPIPALRMEARTEHDPSSQLDGDKPTFTIDTSRVRTKSAPNTIDIASELDDNETKATPTIDHPSSNTTKQAFRLDTSHLRTEATPQQTDNDEDDD